MNKTKKFVVTLLSVLMVLSFMPAMSFAGTAEWDDENAHIWDDGTVIKEANCVTGDWGVKQWKCEGENNLPCAATDTRIVDPEHSYSYKNLTVDDIIEAAIDNFGEENLRDQDILNIYAHYYGYCRGLVPVCDDCGYVNVYLHYSRRERRYLIRDGLTDDTLGQNWITQHSDPTNTCYPTYVCEFCGRTVTNPDYDYTKDTHDWKRVKVTDKITKTLCGTNCTASAEFECTVCGSKKKEIGTYNASDDSFTAYTEEIAQEAHTGIGTPVTPKTGEESQYVKIGDKYYTPNEEVIPAECEETGISALVCADCGETVGYAEIPATGHQHPEVLTIPATCTHGNIKYTFCADCAAPLNAEITGEKLAHTYKITEYSKASCFERGLTVIECTACKEYHTAEELEFMGLIAKADDEYYFGGFERELFDAGTATAPYAKCIKINDWHQVQHDFGAYEKAVEATCEEGELLARKCSKCDAFYAHDVKESGKPLGHDPMTITIPATCGTWGREIVSCKRCKEELDWKYTDAPIVAEGAECTFVWTVTKAPTATEDGEEALVCSVCKAVKEGSETVIPKDSDKAKDIAISLALPIIGQAADIMNDTANYKASSIAAIKEAKDILNGAIASGNAADVNRAAEALDALVKAAEKKDANPMVAKAKTVKAKSSKKTTIKKAKAFTVKKAQGKVTFKKASGNKKITVSKAGKVTVKKGLKKGKTYKVKVKVTAAGNGDYLKKTKTVTLKVKVTK